MRLPGPPAAFAWGLALLICLWQGGQARAHALGAQCLLKGGKVEVEAYYSDDTPGRDAKVTVLDADRKVIADGHTDDEGLWSFPAPPPGRYLVDVNAGEGHRVRVPITVPAVERPDQASPPPVNREAPSDQQSKDRDPPPPPVRISEGPSREEFTAIPWLKIALGLGLIGTAGVALWVGWGRRRRPPLRPL